MAFSHKIISSEGGEVRYVTATENGRPAWYFVRLFPERYAEYKRALKSASFSLNQFGEVLECGWGEEAPEDILQEMQKLHNVIY